jgi:hypothetical protein
MSGEEMKYFKRLFLTLLILGFTSNLFALGTVRLGPSYFPETARGRPVALGSIYVGQPDLDPSILANQKQLSVRQESGTVVTVSQPISTSAGGIPLYLGSPVTLLVDGYYSLKVLDSSGTQVYYVPSSNPDALGAAQDNCYPDYNAVNQGLTGDNDTIKYCVDTYGSDQGTIVLRHNSGNATTPYTLTTSETIPANITLKVERGAVIDGAGTLSINGSIVAGHYQIFGASLTVSGDPIVDKVSAKWFGAIGNNSNDDTIELQAAINFSYNRELFIPSGIYIYSDTLTVEVSGEVAQIKIKGETAGVVNRTDLGGSILKAHASFTGKPAINVILARYVNIEDIYIYGPGAADADSYGLQLEGAGDKVYVKNVNITDFETGIVIGDLTTHSNGNSGNFFYNTVVDTCTYAIRNGSQTGGITQFYGSSFGTNTQYGLKSEVVGAFTGSTIEFFGGEIGSWDIILQTADVGQLNFFDTAFNPPEVVGVDTKPDPPTLLVTGTSNNLRLGANFYGCIFAFNINQAQWWDTTKKFVTYKYAGALNFHGCSFRAYNPIFDLGGGGSEGQSVSFIGNTWQYAPDLSGAPRYTIIEDVYVNQNLKTSYNQDIRFGDSTTELSHITYSKNGIRTEYRSSIPTKGFWKAGSKIFNTGPTGAAGWICTTEGKLGTLTVSIDVAVATTTVNITGATSWTLANWEVGDVILIPGAGVAGADLSSTIVEISLSGSYFVIANDASTTVSGVTATHGSEIAVLSEFGMVSLSGSVTWNPASLADGAGETSSGITVTGAALGDYVIVSSPYDLQDCIVTGYVQAANTVEIRLQNESGGTKDLASGTWKVRVIK